MTNLDISIKSTNNIHRPWKPFDPEKPSNHEVLVVRRFSNAKDVQKNIEDSSEIVSNVERDILPPGTSVDENGNNIVDDDANEQSVTPTNNMESIIERVTRESFQLTMLNNEDQADGNYISSEVSTVEYDNHSLITNGLEADVILSPADLVQQAKLVDDKEFSSICPLCKHNEEMTGCSHMYQELEHHVVEVDRETNECMTPIVNGIDILENGVKLKIEIISEENNENIIEREKIEIKSPNKEAIGNVTEVTDESDVITDTDNTTEEAKSEDVNQDENEKDEEKENSDKVTKIVKSQETFNDEKANDKDEVMSNLVKAQDVNTDIGETESNEKDQDKILDGISTEKFINKENIKEEEPIPEIVIQEVKVEKDIKENISNELQYANKTDIVEEVSKSGGATVSFVDQSLATPNPTPRTRRRLFGSMRSKSKKRNKNKISISNFSADIERALQGI